MVIKIALLMQEHLCSAALFRIVGGSLIGRGKQECI